MELPAEPSRPADSCRENARSAECRCESGDVEACLELADASFRQRDPDGAIIRAFALCQREVPEGCLRAAHYLERRRIQSRFGATAKELRERGLALFEKQCSSNEAAACFRLGKALFQGKYTAGDVPRGAAHVERACDAGHGPACLFLAGAHDSGAGIKRDQKRALLFLEKGCQAGGASSCAALGDKVARSDAGRAMTLYEQACAGEDATGCARSGKIHAGRGDHERAFEALMKACELEHPASCADAAALLAGGTGVRQDAAKARVLHRSACDDGVGSGCLGLASLVASGAGGDRNWGEAVRLYEKACKLKAPGACKEGARLRRRPPDWRCATVDDCQKRCDEELGKACTQLGRLLATQAGDPGCTEAGWAYENGCKHGDAVSCVFLGNNETDKAEAESWYAEGCRRGSADACVLHDFVRHASAEPAEQKKAARSLQRSCTARAHPSACVLLGRIIETSQPARARQLWTGACNEGNGRACRLLAHQLGVFPSLGGTSSQELDPGPQQLGAAIYEKGLDLLRRGCELDDTRSCWDVVHLEPDTSQRWKTHLEELEQASPCGNGINWEPY